MSNETPPFGVLQSKLQAVLFLFVLKRVEMCVLIRQFRVLKVADQDSSVNTFLKITDLPSLHCAVSPVRFDTIVYLSTQHVERFFVSSLCFGMNNLKSSRTEVYSLIDVIDHLNRRIFYGNCIALFHHK